MKTVLVPILLGAAIIAGCGGGRLSSDQLVDRASAICAQAVRQTGRIPTPSTPNAGMPFLSRGIPVLTRELAKLRTLKAPEDAEDVYGTAMQAFSHKLAALESAVRELKTGANPVTAMTALAQQLAPIEAAEDGAWRALEVPACLNR